MRLLFSIDAVGFLGSECPHWVQARKTACFSPKMLGRAVRNARVARVVENVCGLGRFAETNAGVGCVGVDALRTRELRR